MIFQSMFVCIGLVFSNIHAIPMLQDEYRLSNYMFFRLFSSFFPLKTLLQGVWLPYFCTH